MTDDDRRRPRDRLRYAHRATSHLGSLSSAELLEDALRQDALERSIELIEEAASKISFTCRDRLADVPWEQIIGTRHIIAHDYGAIDHAILVDIVRQHLPSLIAAVENRLAEEPHPP